MYIYICMKACVYTKVCIHIYIYTNVYTLYIYVRVSAFAYSYICIYVVIYICLYIGGIYNLSIYTSICVHTYIGFSRRGRVGVRIYVHQKQHVVSYAFANPFGFSPILHTHQPPNPCRSYASQNTYGPASLFS